MKLAIVLVGLVLMFSFISANFEIGELSHLIESQYSASDKISGWINISLEDEPVDSLFEDSFGNSVSLIDLLKANVNLTYTCSTGGCFPNYESSNPEATKTFGLNSGAKKVFGFQITEDIVNVNSVTLNVESDAAESCSNQLEIDFLKNNDVDVVNNKLSTSYCSSSKNYGCFSSWKPTSLAKIDYQSYCQKITLSESPGFKIGAWVQEKTAGSTRVSMTLYDSNRKLVDSCNLPAASSSGGEVSCDVNYSTVKSEEYYVCVSSSGSGGEYFVRGYTDSNGCGYKGYPNIQSPEDYAYQIFAEGKKFSAMDSLKIVNVLPDGSSISKKINDYIKIKYDSDCSSGCVVPIEFTSRMNQNLVLKNLSVNYDIGGGLVGVTDKFYDLFETPSTINSGFQKINLDGGNFSVPSDYGENVFELSLNGEEIFSEEITIMSSPEIQNLRPKLVASTVPTEFKVLVDSFNVTAYEWNFGNGTNFTTSVNKITYTYDEIGSYELKVTITDNNQLKSSKTFVIEVISPEQAINTSLKKKLDDLGEIDSQMKQFKFETNLKSVLNFDTLDNNLNKVQQDYKSASSENDYKKIMGNLLKIEVPESINLVANADLITFYPQKKNINFEIIKKIAGGSYDLQYSDQYADALISWNQKNVETKVTFIEFSASYGYFDEVSILRTFEFQINKKNNVDKAYFIIANLEGIEFEGNSSVREESGYLYFELEQDKEIISFTTTENVNFVDVPVFISPELQQLKIAESVEVGEAEKSSKWIFFIFILIFLLIAGVVVYVILQEWYKRKYENYLFKKRNDLYNLMIYITEEKKKGSLDKDIYAKLKKSGWGSEQVNYVLRKYSGKRTGMFEIISFEKKKAEANQNSNNVQLQGKFPLTKKFGKVKSK